MSDAAFVMRLSGSTREATQAFHKTGTALSRLGKSIAALNRADGRERRFAMYQRRYARGKR